MMPFIHRDPTEAEERLLALMLSTFTDGSGTQREDDGASSAGWKEIERVFSEFFTGGKHSEDKDVFDLIATDWDNDDIVYGVSVKSKRMSGSKTLFSRHPEARAYLELSNSPAKMWAGITRISGCTSADFESHRDPQRIGDALMETIEGWKIDRAVALERQLAGKRVDLDKTYYLTLSWSPYREGRRQVQISSFPMKFPKVEWFRASDRCLSAYDPEFPGERLLDWYPLSGGQLKFYPRYSNAHFASNIMQIDRVEEISIFRKTKTYFPDDFSDIENSLEEKQLLFLRRLIGIDITNFD
jgi:hypothetical protein